MFSFSIWYKVHFEVLSCRKHMRIILYEQMLRQNGWSFTIEAFFVQITENTGKSIDFKGVRKYCLPVDWVTIGDKKKST
jgi:hypothetical protein